MAYRQYKTRKKFVKDVHLENNIKAFTKEHAWRAQAPLELFHTDICGPIKTSSHVDNIYFIIFIDDYSRMTWMYFMRHKSRAFTIFKKFKDIMERQSEHYIKVLRSDRGGEYNSNEFEKFCEDVGLQR